MKLVTYSEPRNQSRTRPGLLWGSWILDLQDIPNIDSRLDIKIPRRVAKIASVASTLDLVTSGSKGFDALHDLSWRIFNRLDPEKIPRAFKSLVEVRLR